MKSAFFSMLTVLGMTSTAYGRVLKVERYDSADMGRAIFTATVEICDRSFPTVSHEVSLIAPNKVAVALDVYPGNCANPTTPASFFILLEHDLSALGLDPATTEIFMQVQ